ncbi:DEAD/DEAH box helicase family protein [Nocardioides dilutus]
MTSILWLTGVAGVGKSVTAWQAFTGPGSEALAYLDVDQVGMLYPDDETDEYGYSLKNEAVHAIASNLTAAGAGRLLVSGVVDPREPGETVRLERAGLRYCLLIVDDQELRRRLLERGWDESDADEMAAEQAHLSAMGFADSIIDTTDQPVAAAAERVRAELSAMPDVDCGQVDGEPVTVLPERTVFITGPRGVGCSTVGFGLARRAWSVGTRAGFADLEQLSFVRATGTTRTHQSLGISNLAAMASLFASKGARLFIANGHLRQEDEIARLRRHLPGVVVVRLRADADTLEHHILDRLGGNEARLTGDDLADATANHRQRVLARALRDQQQMDDDGIGDLVIDVDDLTPAASVDATGHVISSVV